MKTGLTELVFILDRSGSMSGLESDTIGGFNSMLAKQQAEPGECRITTVLFDNNYEMLHDRTDLKAVSPITEREYFVRGSTALLDAIGRTINKIDNALKNTAKEYRANKVLFVVITDGMENASVEFSYRDVKSLVNKQKTKRNWEFIFLGANIDAIDVANHFGIPKNRVQNFHNDSKGVALNYNVVSQTISTARCCGEKMIIPDGWGDKIYEDYKTRNGREL